MVSHKIVVKLLSRNFLTFREIFFFYFLQELQILEEELLDSMDVQESHIRDLKRELNRLETEHQSLKEPSRY